MERLLMEDTQQHVLTVVHINAARMNLEERYIWVRYGEPSKGMRLDYRYKTIMKADYSRMLAALPGKTNGGGV